jgi:ectoine hydroxylase-related dioxygenase (phytanoyl-CoA dioxygenase family)
MININNAIKSIETEGWAVIPGSHLSGKYASQDALKDAVPIESKAGDMVIWDTRLWHATSNNTSGRTRWAILATFTRWWIKQMFDIPRSLPQHIYEKLTDKQKAVMGFCSISNKTEMDGIDLISGYEKLQQEVKYYY